MFLSQRYILRLHAPAASLLPRSISSAIVHRSLLKIRTSSHFYHSRVLTEQFRLLRGRRDPDGNVRVELKTFPVDSPDTPPFHAVSYAWGAPPFRNSIQTGEGSVSVPDSLLHFLTRVLSDEFDCWWWADSICINQSDSTEKVQQLPLMRSIFGTADSTYVWLGEESEDSDLAMAFLNYLGDAYWSEFASCPSTQYASWIQALASRNGEHRTKWQAVERLFQRPWWQRVWTVQEYVISKSIVFQCGRSTIDGKVFNKALSAIWACHRATGVLRYDAQWNRNRILEVYNLYWPSPSLTALLAYLGDHFSTDPRDRLYSLSGLVHDPDIMGEMSYHPTVAEVYTNLVKNFVAKYKSLDIICFATAFSRADNPKFRDRIPSWVPDWSVPSTPLVVPLMVSQSAQHSIGNLRPRWAQQYSAEYRASLNRNSRVFFPENGTMRCEGIILGTIDGLAEVTGWTTWRTALERESDVLVQPISTSAVAKSPASAASVQALMRCLVLDRKDHYMNQSAPAVRFTNEFRALVNAADNRSTNLHTHFSTWYHANKSLKIRGTDLATLFKQTFTRRIFSAHESPEPYSSTATSERQTFASRFHDTTVKMAKRLVVTEEGLLAMAPRRSRQGDIVCILYGCNVPVVLRVRSETGDYQFVGECYVDGFMNGEAFVGEHNHKECVFTLV